MRHFSAVCIRRREIRCALFPDRLLQIAEPVVHNLDPLLQNGDSLSEAVMPLHLLLQLRDAVACQPGGGQHAAGGAEQRPQQRQKRNPYFAVHFLTSPAFFQPKTQNAEGLPCFVQSQGVVAKKHEI